MPYSYQDERPWVFTEEGQADLVAMLDRARVASDAAGAVTTFKLMRDCRCGDSWKMLALIDRLVEMKYLRRVGEGWRSDNAVYVVKDVE